MVIAPEERLDEAERSLEQTANSESNSYTIKLYFYTYTYHITETQDEVRLMSQRLLLLFFTMIICIEKSFCLIFFRIMY